LLRLEVCEEKKSSLEDFVGNTITDFGGLRRANRIGKEVDHNLKWLEDGGWHEIEKQIDKLKECRSRLPQQSDITIERKATRIISDNMKGFGPKQSRNLWQSLGLTRLKIPIDSRITKWLNRNNFPIRLSANALQDSNYYFFVMDGIQTLCVESGALPCVLDAAIFASFDQEWSEEELIWLQMIPKDIERAHIIKAINKVKKTGVPPDRTSRKFALKHNEKLYLPKYIISLACKYATGKKLNPEQFSGGSESNDFLKSRGFKIIKTSSDTKSPAIVSHEKKKFRQRQARHDERCPNCKKTIKYLLQEIYGQVETNYKFSMGTRLEDFRNAPYYELLKNIYKALQHHRGFKDFVKAKTLPNCDFYVPRPGFIVEFDESQHFTKPRAIALKKFSKEIRLGFDQQEWIDRCFKFNSRDNDPPYRDEQRAWYDTLRDICSLSLNQPIVRLLPDEARWCSLDPNKLSDVERFENIINEKLSIRKIKVKEKQAPELARIIIAKNWTGDLEKARTLLHNICNKWPKKKKVCFLVTCGGFIQFNWPESLSRDNIGDNKNPKYEAVDILVKEAENCARDLLSQGLADKLKTFTDCITLGIDSFKNKISIAQNLITQPHIELVFIVDLRSNKFFWTGKPYPTPGQQDGLLRICDLHKHFIDLKDLGKVMVLGCHDLSIFNNRNWKNTGRWRKRIKTNFRNLAQQEKPSIVLHHPHTTVKITTWRNAWNFLNKIIPSVKQYAGTGRFYEPDRPRSELDVLDDVLYGTSSDNTIDFIIR